MSKDFDLEPPKAPAGKKEKKGFLGKLFSSKSESSTTVIPKPDSADIEALREKLGIGPVRSASTQEHFDKLEKGANADADELSKKYDEEQSSLPTQESETPASVEGSLDNALEEFSKSKGLETPEQDTPLFIDPSLVDEHNTAQEEETKKELEEGFEVTDFANDLEDAESSNEPSDSSFASEEMSQIDTSGEESNLSSPLDEEIEPVAQETSALASESQSESLPIEEKPAATTEDATTAPVESSDEETSMTQSWDQEPSLVEEPSFSEEPAQNLQESSPFTQEVPQEPQDTLPSKEKQYGSYEETPFAQSEFIDEGDEQSSSLVREPTSQEHLEQEVGLSDDHDAIAAEFESSQSEPLQSNSSFAQDPESMNQEVQEPVASSGLAQEETPIVATPKTELQSSIQTQQQVETKLEKKTKAELLALENEQEILAQAREESDKEFKKYLSKEEKITASFLKREKTLQTYLDSEKKNFVEVVGLQSLSPSENQQVIEASATFEAKLKELYAKKYDSFSKWIQQESKLLKENLDNFKEKVALEKAQIKQLTKDVTKSQKEFKALHKKTLAEQKKLLKLEEKQQQKIDDLIARETAVRIAEEEVMDSRETFAKLTREIEEANQAIAIIEDDGKKLKKDNKSLEAELKKQKEQSKEKQKHIKDLDKTIAKRQKELDNKDKLLESLHKKEKKFITNQKSSNELLAQREEAVLERINANEKILRTIELKRAALAELENKIESDGFQSYIDAKLDQINPDQGILSDEEHILDDSPELGLKIHKLLVGCRSELSTNNFAQAKKIYAQIRQEYVQLEIPHEEKLLLYAKIRELYDDINLKMLRERSEVRSVDVS